MIIVNKSIFDILCIVDSKSYVLHANEFVEFSNLSDLEIQHTISSYICSGTDKSKILKILSFLDDPFKTNKDYHICIDAKFCVSNYSENSKLIIEHKSMLADVPLQLFYDYFVVNINNELELIPEDVSIVNKNDIYQKFLENNHKRIKWSAIWNIFIEPVIFEIIGYLVIYKLFSLWIGTKALWIITILIFANILIETLIFCLKTKSNDNDKFNLLLLKQNIINSCYLKQDSQNN